MPTQEFNSIPDSAWIQIVTSTAPTEGFPLIQVELNNSVFLHKGMVMPSVTSTARVKIASTAIEHGEAKFNRNLENIYAMSCKGLARVVVIT